jgi:hypothetical protein
MSQLEDPVADREALYAKVIRFMEFRSQKGCEVVLRSEFLPVMKVSVMLVKSQKQIEQFVEEGSLDMKDGFITGDSVVNFLDYVDRLIEEL